MTKTILITGATDGIGRLTAEKLAAKGHEVALHGRNSSKLEAAAKQLPGDPATFTADLSDLAEVDRLVSDVRERFQKIDVLINNAGVYKTPQPITATGHDVRFIVNTIAPYRLTLGLLPLLGPGGRVINLSSAAQAPVDLQALLGQRRLDDMAAYAQSKLAITAWTADMAKRYPEGPMFVSVNPGSLLASKMVKEGFGVAGSDLNIGADILCRAALDDTFADANGKYFDNDSGRFAPIAPVALSPAFLKGLREAMEAVTT